MNITKRKLAIAWKQDINKHDYAKGCEAFMEVKVGQDS